MKQLTIGEAALDIAERRAEAAGTDTASVDHGQNLSALGMRVLDDIRTLIAAEVIAPLDPATLLRISKDLPLAESWILNSRDLERVRKYAWQNAPDIKQRYLETLTAVFTTGLYTLEEAAEAVEIAIGERPEPLVEKLKLAALSGEIPMYEPGMVQKYVYDLNGMQTRVREFHEKAHWHNLNAWLEKHEPMLFAHFRFPTPTVRGSVDIERDDAIDLTDTARIDDYGSDEFIRAQSASGAAKQRRRHLLDPIIDRAIAQANGLDSAHVWIKLKEIALNSEAPFMGTVHDTTGALGYTNSKNKQTWLTQEALQQRLRRRSQANAPNCRSLIRR